MWTFAEVHSLREPIGQKHDQIIVLDEGCRPRDQP